MTEAPQSKRLKTSPGKSIGTHNGAFHCDEALAVFLLKQTAAYKDADIVRTRDPAILATCDIVVDVGAVYDETLQRFDHHQREFVEIFGHGFTTKLSSAGLIYKHFGKEIIASQLNYPVDDSRVMTLWLKLYKEFIEALDAVDNGISQYPEDISPKYTNKTDLSSRVGWLNPSWNEDNTSQNVDAQFEKASTMAGSEFLARLKYYGLAWMPARDQVFAAISRRQSSTDKLIVFERSLPWKEHLFDIENELQLDESTRPLYVLYPDETASNWRVQAIPVSSHSFESRKALPRSWRGVRDEQLSEVAAIPGCIFVHASGFIGGNATKEGALAMAKKALELNDP